MGKIDQSVEEMEVMMAYVSDILTLGRMGGWVRTVYWVGYRVV